MAYKKTDRIESFTNECLDYIHDFASDTIGGQGDYLEGSEGIKVSPLEQLFFIAFDTMKITEQIEPYIYCVYSTEIKCSNGKKYYPDFVFNVHHGFKTDENYGHLNLLVELDGHIWHEKTPNQVEKEKQRERDLVKDGYTILRYSGREVWRDPIKIVEEVHREYWKRIMKELDKKDG